MVTDPSPPCSFVTLPLFSSGEIVTRAYPFKGIPRYPSYNARKCSSIGFGEALDHNASVAGSIK
jgi:hypothetical protein